MKKVLKGKKVNSSHSTYTEAAEIVIVAAKSDPSVTKISLGEIVPLRSGKIRLKFNPINGGYKVTVRGKNEQQLIYIYTKDPGVPIRLIKKFEEK